jgi:hypothetical protein
VKPDTKLKVGIIGWILLCLGVAVRALWSGPNAGDRVTLERGK